MARFGLAERHAALADGLWRELSESDESDELEDLKVPDDLAAALAGHPCASHNFANPPRSTWRGILGWGWAALGYACHTLARR